MGHRKNKICGIYQIINDVTKESYVGSSKNILERFAKHKAPSIRARCSEYPLYKAFEKYGIESFSLIILEECSENILLEREQFFIETIQPEYNRKKAIGKKTERKNRKHNIADISENKVSYSKNYNRLFCNYNGKITSYGALSTYMRRHKIDDKPSKYLIENF